MRNFKINGEKKSLEVRIIVKFRLLFRKNFADYLTL